MPEKVLKVRKSTAKRRQGEDAASRAARRMPAALPANSRLRKLHIGNPGDTYEREADRVAERVLSQEEGAAARPAAVEVTPLTGSAAGVRGRVLAQVFAGRRGGNPLDGAATRFLEPRFQYDFRRVRVHTGSFAARVCRSIGADALTAGKNIFFGAGRYRPETPGGRRLLAHELAHVVQQRNAPALQAYGRNVHYENTKRWAEDVFGRGSREAETIAREDQGVDEGWTHPHLTTPAAFIFPVSDNDLRHFPSRPVAQAAVEEAIDEADPAAFGRALHRYQDSYSHSFPPGAPLSDLSRARDGATGLARDVLLQLHRVFSNTRYGRGAAIWHALLGYYPDDFKVNSEQRARDDEMERGSKNYIRMFHSIWSATRLMRVPVPPGLTVPGMLFGPHHVAPYMRR
ncbi:MAG: DUF4157 domain-containing protein [Bacillota bacterium]